MGVEKKYMDDEMENYFSLVFRENRWGNDETVSGAGSALASSSVRDSIKILDYVVRTYGIRSISDIPCGDFYWIPIIIGRFPNIEYHGYDIVADLIKWNKDRYPYYDFQVVNAVNRVLPREDLIFCKDLFIHIKFEDIAKILRNFKLSGSRYLLTSNDYESNNIEINIDEAGAYRYVNLINSPFNLPEPIFHTNYLSLWGLDAIPLGFFDDLVNKF